MSAAKNTSNEFIFLSFEVQNQQIGKTLEKMTSHYKINFSSVY